MDYQSMSVQTKIQLSSFERELLNNSEWILTKNNIISKALELLGAVQGNISDYTLANANIFPAEVTATSPKISKGENYLGLPWLMLDYPRYFDKENVFAIRTMFWWGNFFSTTLHLSGKYKDLFSEPLIKNYEELKKNQFFICIHVDQWHHHLESENYKPVDYFSVFEFEKQLRKKPFIKLAKKISFSDWDSAIQLLSDEFVRITGWLN